MMRSTFPTAHLFAFIFLAFGFINHTNAQNDQEPIRINVGGKRYRDNKGDIWSADEYYRNGKVFSDSRWIFDTNDGTLYRSSRYDNTRNTNSLSYSIPVKNGNYVVRLHFAELYKRAQKPGARIFDVLVEDNVVFPRLDIFAHVGGFAALIKETKVQVNDGELSLSFERRIENPVISAIEVFPTSDDDNGCDKIPETSPDDDTSKRSKGSKTSKSSDGSGSSDAEHTEVDKAPPRPAHPTESTSTSTPEPARATGGTAIWAKKGKDTMRFGDFDGENYLSINIGPNIQHQWSHVRGAKAPTRDEMLLVGVTDEGDAGDSTITAAMRSGEDWERISIDGVGSTLGTVSNSIWNNAQVTYESQSGDALLIWHDDRRLLYSKWNGEKWTAVESISGITEEPQWFDIASNPLSNEIVAVLSDSSNRVYVLVWNGSRWSDGPLQVSTGSHQAGIAVAYESQSGRAMVVYGKDTKSTGVQYRIWNGTEWSSEASLESPLGESTVRWAVLRSDPRSNHLVLGIHNGDEGAWLSFWNGSSWAERTTVAATTSAGTQTNSHPVVHVAFESRSGNALAVYRNKRGLKYRTLKLGSSSWSRGLSIPEYRELPTSIILESEPGSDQIMMLVQDDDGDVHSGKWNGDKESWDLVIKLESDTGERSNRPFSFLWKAPQTSLTARDTLPPPPTPSSDPFGVDGFTFVDADKNKDVVGALDCDPINSCIGSVRKFSVRANTFGKDIESVQITMNGPIPRVRVEEEPPYSIFGDRRGNYRGKSLLAGTYRLSAFAVNLQGDVSKNYTMTFDIAEAPTRAPTREEVREDSSPSPTPRPIDQTSDFRPVLINCGGSAFTDASDTLWQADAYFNGGAKSKTKASQPIYYSENEELFRTERWASSSKEDLQYNIPVPNGEYSVSLYFSENYKRLQGPGLRVFSIWMEDFVAFPSVDIFAESGGYTAMRLTKTVDVNDSLLTIRFSSIVQNPKISGIEVHLATNTPYEDSAPLNPVPTSPPTPAPTRPENADFVPIRINAGGEDFTDKAGLLWASDDMFSGGESFDTDEDIAGTSNQALFQTGRSSAGEDLEYEIEVPNGEYLVSLYFVDIFPETHRSGARVFDVYMEGFGEIKDIDVFSEVEEFALLKKQAPVIVTDEKLSIEFRSVVNDPIISAIEVEALGMGAPIQAHAVAGGPYFAFVPQGDEVASVTVDGSFSHSHGPNAKVVSWKWKLDGKVVGRKETLTLDLPVGLYDLTLLVVDSDNARSRDSTTITVQLPRLPEIEVLKPDTANVAGGEALVIIGKDFTASENDTTVHFGSENFTGPSEITVIDDTTIVMKKIPSRAAGSVDVRVETPDGYSNVGNFTYIKGTPVAFSTGTVIQGTYGPTCITTAPNGMIYVGTQTGLIIRIDVNDKYEPVANMTSYVIAGSSYDFRSILGIAFDPMDTSPNPPVYISHSTLFHGNLRSHNGKVSRVSGPNLDEVEDIVTGLPVSDLDHGVNGLEFGDNGELYILVGANTNAGVPGPLSSTGRQKDELFSGSTLVAHLSRPEFDGDVTYDENGDQISGFDVEIFASGQRNPYDITLHSNGFLYATDNGANFGFGRRSMTCDTDTIDPNEDDELNLIEKGNYYGHANRKRGEMDPRQCRWRAQTEKSDDEYTAPIALLPSSVDGVIEFQTEHFDGKLRGDLILSQYKGGLYRVQLSSDGRYADNKSATFLDENGGLALTQGPDGTLFVAKNDDGKVIFVTPKERASNKLKIKSVFPRRGPQEGGSMLSVFGENLINFGTPRVSLGGKDCPVDESDMTDSKIKCRLPSGNGTVDIEVSTGTRSGTIGGGSIQITTTAAGSPSSTFRRGYRYISGSP